MHFNPTLEKFLPNIHEKPSLSMILAKKNFSQSTLRRKVIKNMKSLQKKIRMYPENKKYS
jgi:hypothetical protein